MKGAILIAIAAIGYATVALFGKWIIQDNLSIYTALSWRFGFAALFLSLFQIRASLRQVDQKDSIPSTSQQGWKDRLFCIFLGIVGDALQTTFFFFAVARVGASLSALLLYTFPVFVLLLQRFIFNRVVTKREWALLPLALFGCLLILDPTELSLGNGYSSGIGFGFMTAIVYAAYLSFGAYATKSVKPLFSSFYLTLGAFISFSSIALLRGSLLCLMALSGRLVLEWLFLPP